MVAGVAQAATPVAFYCAYTREGLANRLAKRVTGRAKRSATAETNVTAFVVAQARQALQHAVAVGVNSAARFASGSIRALARSNMPRRVAPLSARGMESAAPAGKRSRRAPAPPAAHSRVVQAEPRKLMVAAANRARVSTSSGRTVARCRGYWARRPRRRSWVGRGRPCRAARRCRSRGEGERAGRRFSRRRSRRRGR